MTSYDFSIFQKAGIEPAPNAIVYGIKSGLLHATAASDFEEWMITQRGIEGSSDLLICQDAADALTALSEAGYRDDGLGADVLRYALLASLSSQGQELLDEIEGIYADFNYPKDMEPFIYYMPSSDENSSTDSLIDLFRAFLTKEKNRLNL